MEHVETKLKNKQKRLKIKKKHQNDTIDYHHTKRMNYFKELQTIVLPKKIKELEKCKKEIEDIKKVENYTQELNKAIQQILLTNDKKKYNYTVYHKKLNMLNEHCNHLDNYQMLTKDTINKFPELKKIYNIYQKLIYYRELSFRINLLEQEILKIKNKTEEIDYFDKNLSILNDYYTNSQISEENIKEYFIINNIVYYEEESLTKTELWKCKICPDSDLSFYVEKGYAVCEDCGFILHNITGNDYNNLTYLQKQETEMPKQKFLYQRRQYFKECLCQIQGKETIDISENMISEIKNQLKIENYDLQNLNIKLMRKVLKLKGYSKFYEHIPLIIKMIAGSYPLNIPENIENTLIYMFDVVNELYEKYKPENLKNTTPINYYLYKFCQILGYSQFLPYFPMLKDKKKIHERDKVWEKIIEHIKSFGIEDYNVTNSIYMKNINWRYISTV